MGDKLLSVVFGWFIMPLIALFGGLFIIAEYAETHEWYESVVIILVIAGIAISLGVAYLFGQAGAKTHVNTSQRANQRPNATSKVGTTDRSKSAKNDYIIDHSTGGRSILTTPHLRRHRFTTRANLDHRKN